jgi:signal peptidase I
VAVYSGSMKPTIPVGGLAIDRAIPAHDVRVGDVITFSDPYVKGRLVTHRVIDILETPHGLAYRTKGDANPGRDPWTIRLAGKVGRVSFTVPVAGYVLYYAHTREVRGALICLAALLLGFAMLRSIWRKESTAPAGA